MSKVNQSNERGKPEHSGPNDDLEELEAEALRLLNSPNRLDAKLLDALRRREESLEPLGPLAGKVRAGGWM